MKKNYLERQVVYPPFVLDEPNEQLEMVVVIPAFDEPDLEPTLNALLACDFPGVGIEVLIVLNYSELANEQIKHRTQEQFNWLSGWAQENNTDLLRFYGILATNLPKKKAGVGLARKIGLDEGVRRLMAVNPEKGVLVCFDADSLCKTNYFQKIHTWFQSHPKMDAVSIGYAHPLAGEQFAEKIYESIIAYELHLRYFLMAKKMAGCPHAIETIGSAMAVRVRAYQEQGGMNQRKAGEDFYFLHKFITTGRCGEILEPLVIPSPRVSHRVPFGTGKAVGDMLSHGQDLDTYDLKIFSELKIFLDQIPHLYQLNQSNLTEFLKSLPNGVHSFLITQAFEEKFAEIRQNTSDYDGFYKRFFRWADAFWVMKYVHFVRDHFYPNIPLDQAARFLLEIYYPNLEVGELSKKSLLKIYRGLVHCKLNFLLF